MLMVEHTIAAQIKLATSRKAQISSHPISSNLINFRENVRIMPEDE